jgi:hypothetical protein
MPLLSKINHDSAYLRTVATMLRHCPLAIDLAIDHAKSFVRATSDIACGGNLYRALSVQALAN